MSTRIHVIATDRAVNLHIQARDEHGHFVGDSHPVGRVEPHSHYELHVHHGSSLVIHEDREDGREG